MPDWLQNPHADYVLAAYGVAAVALLGIGIASLIAARRTTQAWRKIQNLDRP